MRRCACLGSKVYARVTEPPWSFETTTTPGEPGDVPRTRDYYPIDSPYRCHYSPVLPGTYNTPTGTVQSMLSPRDNEALAALAISIAEDLQRFANAIREPALTEGEEDEASELSGMGPRQRQAYDLLRRVSAEGIKTSELAEAMQYDVPNTYLTLKSLVNRGLVEMVPGSSPQRWRPIRGRGSSAPYIAAAHLIRPGEWVTYGDVSIAVRGDDRAARAVGRAAATLPDFPNPHRILQRGGVIPEGWRDGEGRGPEECLRRLMTEGVMFKDGHADKGRHLAWEELRQRLFEAGVAVPPLASMDG